MDLKKIKNLLKQFINYIYNGVINIFILTRSRKIAYEDALETNVVEQDTFRNRFIYSILYYLRTLLYYFIFYLIWAFIVQFFYDSGEICLSETSSDLTNRLLFIIKTPSYYILFFLIVAKSIDTLYHTIKFLTKKFA